MKISRGYRVCQNKMRIKWKGKRRNPKKKKKEERKFENS